MRAAFLTGIQQFDVKETEVPEIKSGQVLVKIKSVGICGSDVHYYKKGRIGSAKAVYPYIIGHECSGVIEKVGSEVNNASIGMRVAVEPAVYCYKCHYCKQGKYNICPDVGFLGTPPVPGAYSEYIAIPERNVIEIPSDFSFEEAVLLEPLSIGFHALRLSELEDGCDVAIYGCGTIGLSILSIVRKRTSGKIFAFDKLDYRLDMAKKFGADCTVNTLKDNAVQFITDNTAYGVNRCFEAAGDIEAMYNSAEITAPGGTVILGGIPDHDDVCFNAHTSRRKELNLKFLRRSNFEIDQAIEFIGDNKETVSQIITHRFSLEEIEKGFELMGQYSDNVVKAVINA